MTDDWKNYKYSSKTFDNEMSRKNDGVSNTDPDLPVGLRTCDQKEFNYGPVRSGHC